MANNFAKKSGTNKVEVIRLQHQDQNLRKVDCSYTLFINAPSSRAFPAGGMAGVSA